MMGEVYSSISEQEVNIHEFLVTWLAEIQYHPKLFRKRMRSSSPNKKFHTTRKQGLLRLDVMLRVKREKQGAATNRGERFVPKTSCDNM